MWWMGETLNAAGEFSRPDAERHINWKEMRAVLLVMRAVARWRPNSLRNRRIHLWIDNKVAMANFMNGGGTSLLLTEQAVELFWLGTQFGWHITWSYIPSADNQSDALTREDASNDVRLHADDFNWLAAQQRYGINVDWCASAANTQCTQQGEHLPFVSRYLQEGAAAVDVLAQHLAWVPGSDPTMRAEGYCYPPPALILPLVEVARHCAAQLVLVTTGTGELWWPMVWRAATWRALIAPANESSTRLRGMRPDGSPTTFTPRGAVWAWGCKFGNRQHNAMHTPTLLHIPHMLGAQQEGGEGERTSDEFYSGPYH